jgi:single-strand DNA-binding protein
MNLASITLIGYMGKDAELAYLPSGIAVAKFSLAVTQKRGEKEETVWFTGVAWRGLAEVAAKYGKKGKLVYVSGEFMPHSYTTRDGKSGMALEVQVDRLLFLEKKSPDETTKVATDLDSIELDDPF